MEQLGPAVSRHGLDIHGIGNVKCAHWNYSTPALYEEAVRRGEGVLARGGALVVTTGQHTGRSAGDKFIVEDSASAGDIAWGAVNKPISADHYAGLRRKLLAYLQGREIFVQDCYAGAALAHRLAVRVITEFAWHNLFARNMFITPERSALEGFEPQFTVIQAPGFHADPERDGTNSEVFVIVNFAEREVLIGGTSYAGEIKKSVFSVLNFMLPAQGVLPMHASVNVGDADDPSIFFGLSGTGKTTLSADPKRVLVGDDEHGWGDSGLFNFEGGCYAKCVQLSEEGEPQIWNAIRFGSVLENTVICDETRVPDYDRTDKTENTRVTYPVEFIPGAKIPSMGGHPKNVIFLTADAFGVLPPVSLLSREQAMYYFVNGYTSKLAGTEAGVTEPTPNFSPCFGGPFLPRPPMVYARWLDRRVKESNANVWLLNTGWTGGAYGTGSRFKLAWTRAFVTAILEGSLQSATWTAEPVFGLSTPDACPGVPSDVLLPRQTWADGNAYDAAAADLAKRFRANDATYALADDVRGAGPLA